MVIGVPREMKQYENRVALVPAEAAALRKRGHTVVVETGAGTGSGFADNEYSDSGAFVLSRREVYDKAELLQKVKEIEPPEYDMLRDGQIIFTFLHSNGHLEMTQQLLARKVIGIAYEDIDDDSGEFPILAPMSALAGKGGFLAALHFTQSVHGGAGLLLGRSVGVPVPHITVIGCGSAGIGAALLASSFGNKVTMLDISFKAMEKAKSKLPDNVEFLYSDRGNLETCLSVTDVLINCILWDKTRHDHLISRDDLHIMKRGAIIIDVSCDRQGAVETSRPTTHGQPVYFEEGIMHYCVDNIPSAFSRDASVILSAIALPYTMSIAKRGVKEALIRDSHLRRGLTFWKGELTLRETAVKFGMKYTEPLDALKI